MNVGIDWGSINGNSKRKFPPSKHINIFLFHLIWWFARYYYCPYIDILFTTNHHPLPFWAHRSEFQLWQHTIESPQNNSLGAHPHTQLAATAIHWLSRRFALSLLPLSCIHICHGRDTDQEDSRTNFSISTLCTQILSVFSPANRCCFFHIHFYKLHCCL